MEASETPVVMHERRPSAVAFSLSDVVGFRLPAVLTRGETCNRGGNERAILNATYLNTIYARGKARERRCVPVARHVINKLLHSFRRERRRFLSALTKVVDARENRDV